jgi:hypothetical protein
MSSDSEIEITGYRDPPPSPERIDLTATKTRKRQSSLLDFIASPGQSSSTQWPSFLQSYKPHHPLNKNQATSVSKRKEIVVPKESSDSEEKPDVHAPPQEKKLNSRGKYCAYTLQFKLKAIQAVQASDARTVAKQFQLPRSTLETWVKTYSQDDLKECKSSKGKGKKGAHFKAGAGRPLTYPESMDAELAEWVLHQRDLQRPVSILMLKAKAKAIVSSKYPAFRASKGWAEKFMRRHSLSLRAKTSVSQKLPADLEAKLERFLKQVQVQRKAIDYSPDRIINMDETPMFFDLIPGKTLSATGKKQILVRGTSGSKRHFTVVLACSASGDMLPPMIIFKGKRKVNLKPPSGYVVTVQKKGWMDGDLMSTWLKKIVLPYTKKQKTLLILDSFSAHADAHFALLASKYNINLALIPGGCTSKVQPLDVSLNKPFKDVARHQWIDFVTSSAETTESGNLKAASKEQVVAWVQKGVDYLKEHPEMIRKAFLVCGLSNKVDGSENHYIRCAKELSVSVPYDDSEESESEGDPFAESDSDQDSSNEECNASDEDNSSKEDYTSDSEEENGTSSKKDYISE